MTDEETMQHFVILAEGYTPRYALADSSKRVMEHARSQYPDSETININPVSEAEIGRGHTIVVLEGEPIVEICPVRQINTIETKYHGPTDKKGGRISVSDGKKKLFYYWNSNLDVLENHIGAFNQYCKELNVTGKFSVGSVANGYIFVREFMKVEV